MLTRIFCGFACLAVLGAAALAEAQGAEQYKYFRVGSQADVKTATQPGFALMGGGKDLDEAFRWMCERAGGGDFLVLRATGDDDYNPYIQPLCKLNSVATLICPTARRRWTRLRRRRSLMRRRSLSRAETRRIMFASG